MLRNDMRYRFGTFELVPETRELLAAGKARPVEPQVFDLLLHLVKEHGRVVSADELIKAVWQGRIVSDSAISARISAARGAIDDDGQAQRWIKTLPRRGFRFVGQVNPQAGAQSAPSAAQVANHRQRVAFCRSADGTRIAYATTGAGYPLLRAGHWLTHLEHDWKSPLWRPMLDRLSSDFQVVRYDQRGNGLSDWTVSNFSLDRFVEDLAAVADASGLERFALYGTSQGAPIAVAYASLFPERVSHLILQGGYVSGRLLRASEAERAQGEAIITLIRHGWGKADSPFIKAFATLFLPDGEGEQIDSLAELQQSTTSPENAADIRSAVDRFDVSDMVGSVVTPTLVIHAERDGVQPLDQGRELAARIPGAEFLMLESRNHVILPQEKAWPRLFEAIGGFVLGPK